MFRLSTSFALFVLVITCTLATQQASGVGAVVASNTTKKTATPIATPAVGSRADLITPSTKQNNKIAVSGATLNQTTNQALAETNATLTPRVLADKTKATGPDSMDAVLSAPGPNQGIRTGRIAVKFLDELKVRCISGRGGKTIAATNNTNSETTQAFTTTTKTGKKPTEIEIANQIPVSPIASALGLVDRFGATVSQAINKSTLELTAIEQKAAAQSKRAQPDLAGYIYVTVASSVLTAAAEAFNDLDCVEFAQVEYMPIPAQDCPDVDLSLQKGSASEGVDVGKDCKSFTDSTTGQRTYCPAPPPIFVIRTTGPNNFKAQSLSDGLGAIACNRPSRWSNYSPGITSADCLVYQVGLSTAPNWNCILCNLGGGTSGTCTDPRTGFTSEANCQYGCRDLACSDYLSTLGFTSLCDGTNMISQQGWDATCATLANIYCSGIGTTPYNSIPPTAGMQQVDLPTQSCFGVEYLQLTTQSAFAFDDSTVYDPCFALRGPAIFNFTGTQGVLKYANLENGDGIRPWGFTNPVIPSAIPAFAFLNRNLIPTDPFPVAPANPVCQEMPVTSAYRVSGQIIAADPLDPANAGFAQFDATFGSYPYLLSHPCDEINRTAPGCYTTPCCVYVCTNDPSCCSTGWDTNCVTLGLTSPLCSAQSITFVPATPSGTPNFNATDPTSLRTRNLAVFGNKKQVVATTGEYINSMRTLVSTEPTAVVLGGPIPIAAIPSQSSDTIPLGLDQTYAFINSGFSGGGIDVAGMITYSAQLGMPPSVVRGKNITVGVIDNSAIIDHEDLVGQVTVEVGQTIFVPILGQSQTIDPEHGTAILGILVAADNGFGITGLLPEAKAIFFPAVTANVGGRLASAIISAGQKLTDADVLCIPLAYTAGYTLANDTFYSQLLNVVGESGIATIIPAGNGGFKVTTPSSNSVIVVGAAWPGRQVPFATGTLTSANANGINLVSSSNLFPGDTYCRWRQSNWSDHVGPGGIDVSGWGTGICTLGRGTLFNNLPATRTKNYQQLFGGTSGACAMIAGLVGAMNSFSEELYQGSIGIKGIRAILNGFETDAEGEPIPNNYSNTVHRQCGFSPGTLLPTTLSDLPDVVARGDSTPAGQGTGNHEVGGFPDAPECLEYVLKYQTFPGGSPLEIEVITGSHMTGNKYSVGTKNQQYLKVQGQQTGRGARGVGYGASIPYIGYGLATDLQVRSEIILTTSDGFYDMLFQAYGLVTNGSPSPADPGGDEGVGLGNAVGVLYAYNSAMKRWIYLDYAFISGTYIDKTTDPWTYRNPTFNTTLNLSGYNAQDFIVQQNGRKYIYSRFLSFGFGIIGSYQIWWDQIFAQVNPPIDSGG